MKESHVVNGFNCVSSWGDCQAETCRPYCTHCGPHNSSGTTTTPQVLTSLFPEKTDLLNVKVLLYTHMYQNMCVTADPFSCFMALCCICCVLYVDTRILKLWFILSWCHGDISLILSLSKILLNLKHMKFEEKKKNVYFCWWAISGLVNLQSCHCVYLSKNTVMSCVPWEFELTVF